METEKETTALVTIEQKNAVAIFTGEIPIEPILEHVRKQVMAFVPAEPRTSTLRHGFGLKN